MLGSRRRPFCAVWLSPLATVVTLASCGGVIVEEPGACSVRLSAAAVSHACSHATFGTPADVVSNGKSVSGVHEIFRVSPDVREVTYRPRARGLFAFMTDLPRDIRVVNADGFEVHRQWESAVHGCAKLSFAAAFELQQRANHRVLLEGRAEDESIVKEVLLFVESLANFGEGATIRECPG